MKEHDRIALGMNMRINRRDFLSGVAITASGVSAVATGAGDSAHQADIGKIEVPNDYPPARTGLRGQHPGSFEDAHRLRDGAFPQPLDIDEDTGEIYDLVVVGAGISGLTAAHLYRRLVGSDQKVLILDNHDDFGGHAKRNEFHHDGRVYLASGGTLDIDTPYFPYSYTARSLLGELGVDVNSYSAHVNEALYKGLTDGVFFDREHFSGERLVAGRGSKPWPQFFADAPLSSSARADLIRLHTAAVDYLPKLDAMGKADALRKMSYQTFLQQHAALGSEALPYFSGLAFRNNKRVDTCPAYEAAVHGSPGFGGMRFDAETFPDPHFFFHFPDGNATIARLLTNRLVPNAWRGVMDMESIALAIVDYGQLDNSSNQTRIRLNSTAVRVQHENGGRNVQIIYTKGGRLCRVRGRNVILACTNNIIRFLVPELAEAQKSALAYASKVPMQYTNVLLRNWKPWVKLGVQSVIAPNGYHTELELVPPVSIGGYRFPASPDEPIVARLTRNPNHPGLPRKVQQAMGRQDMLSTSFEKIEYEVRSQLARIFGAAGFDPRRDILAITANRWPHGYAYTYDTLSDPPFADAQYPHVIGRQRLGRISIANADSGAAAFTNEAIDQAARAVDEVLASRSWV